MPRPTKCSRVCYFPEVLEFSPTGAVSGETHICGDHGCGVCAGACPSGAISMMPREFPPQQPKTDKVVEALRALVQSKAPTQKNF